MRTGISSFSSLFRNTITLVAGLDLDGPTRISGFEYGIDSYSGGLVVYSVKPTYVDVTAPHRERGGARYVSATSTSP